MPQQHPPRSATEKPGRSLLRGVEIPAWLASLVLHLLLASALAFALQTPPRQGAAEERLADVGIVLKHASDQGDYYQGDEGESSVDPQAEASAEASNAAFAESTADQTPPVDVAADLPKSIGVLGASGGDHPGNLGSATDAFAGPPGGGGDLKDGQGTTHVFGVPGTGFKFVYVFDRSASMGGSGRNALSAAKAELIASLDSLGKMHQFQIIFYNDSPSIFNPTGVAWRLSFANDQNKQLARRFVGGIIAHGATEHEPALEAAIRLKPDVIFFLTDGYESPLSAGQLDHIRRRAEGITINAIEFGIGPTAPGTNFLERLARQNGGQYRYVDVNRLLRKRR